MTCPAISSAFKVAINVWLQQHPNLLTRDLPNELIIEALSIILKYNTFTFNSKDYIRIRGTAIGTKVAPTYVTLVMGYLENNLYQTIEDRYRTTGKDTFTKSWKRYLDDCFIIWDERIDKIENFLQILQDLHKKDHYDTNVSTNHRQNPHKPYGANKCFRTPQQTYRPDTRNNYSRIRPPYNNNNNYRRPPNANRFQYNTTARTQFGHGQNNSLDHQNSITDLIADNFPTSGIQRTTSDPFLRTSRSQTGSGQ